MTKSGFKLTPYYPFKKKKLLLNGKMNSRFKHNLNHFHGISVFTSCAKGYCWCLLLTEPFLSFAGFHLCELLEHRLLFSEGCEGVASEHPD